MAEYVNKEKLHEILCHHVENVKRAEAAGLIPPKAPDEIGRAIIDIAHGLSYKHNFRNYSWRDEMIDDGIVAATRAINKYDPERSNNPFGFFTQCIYWAFQNRIKRENEEAKQRREYMKSVLDDFYDDGPDGVHHDIDKETIIQMIDR
jgi:sigma factor for late transcription|nr:MAG TPA: RNA polymerase sigma factor [Caudoviricetes sp.]